MFYVASRPGMTVREVADALGLTERRISDILKDLRRAGFLWVLRIGRRNTYRLAPTATFRHPLLSHVSIEAFLDFVANVADFQQGFR